MANLKDDFVTGVPISSSGVNQNFNRLNNMFKRENITSQVDGIKIQFATQHNYVAGSLMVFVDGIAATPVEDIQEDGTNLFTTLFADVLEVGVKLLVTYIREF